MKVPRKVTQSQKYLAENQSGIQMILDTYWWTWKAMPILRRVLSECWRTEYTLQARTRTSSSTCRWKWTGPNQSGGTSSAISFRSYHSTVPKRGRPAPKECSLWVRRTCPDWLRSVECHCPLSSLSYGCVIRTQRNWNGSWSNMSSAGTDSAQLWTYIQMEIPNGDYIQTTKNIPE